MRINPIKKERIDRLLVDRGYVQSRERARGLIMAGMVIAGEKKIEKIGIKISEDTEIRVLGNDIPYVSRGGVKLASAITEFRLDLNGKAAMDIGASTGGFTDCLLQHGVKKVYAIDVGYGQLAWKLRQDKRVINIERTNIRNIDREMIDDDIDIITIDLSFISLKKVISGILGFLKDRGEIIALIKPQFEAGKSDVGKGGIVRSEEIHKRVLNEIKRFTEKLGLTTIGIIPSPISGRKGNQEYLIYLNQICDYSSNTEQGVPKTL
ncbi:MAG: TlyA family RNA methyltransferase [Nitrospirota bacterium]